MAEHSEPDAAEALAQVSAALAESLDPAVVVSRVAASVRALLRCQGATVYRVEETTGTLVLEGVAGLGPEWSVGLRLPTGLGITALGLRSGHPVASDDVLSDAAIFLDAPMRGRLEALNHRAMMSAPLLSRGRVIGAITVADTLGRHFTARDLRHMKMFADMAAIALTNAEQYRAEERLRVDAEAANRAKDDFLAMLGHELRNPLAAIANAAQILDRTGRGGGGARERGDPSSGASSLRARRRPARRRTRLHRQDHPAHDAGGRRGVVAPTGGRPRLPAPSRTRRRRECVGERRRDAARSDHRQPDLERLEVHPAGGEVSARVRVEGSDAVLEVVDTGDGIPAALLPHVFEPFVQGERTPDRTHGGLGLGLALVKRLVEMHGGSVRAASGGPGRGSTFTVHLPRIAAPPALPSSVREDTPVTPRRLLVVEDNADAREVLVTSLRLDGHEVHEAADGHAGLEAAVRLVPDVALIDVGLPGLDGYEVAQGIRSTQAGAAMLLVALTGYGQAEDRRRALAVGFDVHLVKPVAPERLAEVLSSARSATRRS